MPCGGRQPATGGVGRLACLIPQRELRDHPLPALEIAVQQTQHHKVASFDRSTDCLEDLGIGIAERTLPDAVVTGRNVNVPDLGDELLKWRMCPFVGPL